MASVPCGDWIEHETKLNRKWVIQLALLKRAWERGDTGMYAARRLLPEPEFVLTNDHFELQPGNKDGTTKQIPDKTLLAYKSVSIERLTNNMN